MMGFIILPLCGCHACLSLGLNKIGTHEGRSGISVLFANNIIVIISVIFRISIMCWFRSNVRVAMWDR